MCEWRKNLAKSRESRHLRNLFEHLPELFRHLLDQVRSAVKLSRSRLQEFNTPGAIALGNDGLMRVEGRIEVHLAWWHHPDDGAEDGHVRTQQTHASDFAHVGGRDMVGKDLPKRRSDVRPPGHLAPIEADDLPVLRKRSGERISVVLVPAIQHLLIERADLHLIRRWCALRPECM